MGGRRDRGVRAPEAVTANDAQECDDAEGYYNVSIGEIVALPKERGSSVLLAFGIVDDAMGREDATSAGRRHRRCRDHRFLSSVSFEYNATIQTIFGASPSPLEPVLIKPNPSTRRGRRSAASFLSVVHGGARY